MYLVFDSLRFYIRQVAYLILIHLKISAAVQILWDLWIKDGPDPMLELESLGDAESRAFANHGAVKG